ncbi:hypothetical protein BDA96_05G167100 [Sorghum bicolor]|uniref:Uncharacterized protein n=2 Tax=Sorghum bicolor TaxID=4558 RepID=A0A921QZ00_SORBI|nr:hypothetical protein BDA96_05G167100 [Sorghum bicolor]OQU88633.1 hypothetical protein SORBI_3002G064750 [Sorghum bicolor]
MAPTKHPWSQYEGVAAISNVGNNKDISRIILLLRSNCQVRTIGTRKAGSEATYIQLYLHL